MIAWKQKPENRQSAIILESLVVGGRRSSPGPVVPWSGGNDAEPGTESIKKAN